jgi:hypothetical protein
MRRWNPLFLVALLVVVMATVVSITPAGASAHSFPSGISLIKGKIVAKNSNTHYFVLSFTCSLSGTTGTLSGNWTYEVSSTSSFTGTVGPGASCSDPTALMTGGLVTLTGSGNLAGAPCRTPPCPLPTLTLALSNIVAAKTFFNFVATDRTTSKPALCTSPTPTPTTPCLDIEASGFDTGSIPSPLNNFDSQCVNFNNCPTGSGFPFATLNLSTR